jgi:hypothetical protein
MNVHSSFLDENHFWSISLVILVFSVLYFLGFSAAAFFTGFSFGLVSLTGLAGLVVGF